jgi:hypothetical protein
LSSQTIDGWVKSIDRLYYQLPLLTNQQLIQVIQHCDRLIFQLGGQLTNAINRLRYQGETSDQDWFNQTSNAKRYYRQAKNAATWQLRHNEMDQFEYSPSVMQTFMEIIRRNTTPLLFQQYVDAAMCDCPRQLKKSRSS